MSSRPQRRGFPEGGIYVLQDFGTGRQMLHFVYETPCYYWHKSGSRLMKECKHYNLTVMPMIDGKPPELPLR